MWRANTGCDRGRDLGDDESPGSDQPLPQRLGRLLRPKAGGGGAFFYSVVARDTLDAEYAAHRQRFLAEQGYGYVIRDADDLLGPAI